MAIDVSESEFQAAVVDRSHEMPVVVDFWAEWCAPCRQLTPVLEAAESRRTGKVVLVKVDTDANPGISRAFGIQGIPAVKAFRDGQVVSEFVGAQPPAVVESFFDALVPSEADELAAAGDEASLERAVELEPGNPAAVLPLARMLIGRGEDERALELLSNVAGSFAADGLAARIRVTSDGSHVEAFAALDAGELERGLDALLEAVAAADGERDDLRAVIVGVLDELGVEHPLAREYRRRLASALY